MYSNLERFNPTGKPFQFDELIPLLYYVRGFGHAAAGLTGNKCYEVLALDAEVLIRCIQNIGVNGSTWGPDLTVKVKALGAGLYYLTRDMKSRSSVDVGTRLRTEDWAAKYDNS